ncbi:MAG: class I SAM-dependent methyltransferase [Dehalococcoidia bacterium]|nr:class I SAM-dependent methyltransferase [Dehalococcoidia bacterium]
MSIPLGKPDPREAQIQNYISFIADLCHTDKDIISLIYEYLLQEFRNPFYTIEFLIIRSIDIRLANMALKTDDSVLNIGCGRPIAEVVFDSWGIKKIVGIDIDPENIQRGRKWLDDLGITTVELYQGDALSLDFPGESFDVVCSFSAIEHVKGWTSYEKWIENMSKLTRREAVLTTSNKKNLPLYLLGQLVRMEGYEHFFTRRQIEGLLSRHDLKVTYFDTNTLWFSDYIPVGHLGKRVIIKNYEYALKFDLLLEKLRKNILKSYGGRMGFIAHKIEESSQ